MNKKYINILLLISIILIGMLGYRLFNKPSASNISTTSEQTYQNVQYGFNFKLPLSWKGYTILTTTWNGSNTDYNIPVNYEGPEIIIRNPLWTSENTYQDIPIMVFTKTQWDLVQQEKMSVSAAPVGPSKLGQNSKYIFALPARYNFAYETGWEEVESILKTNPLQGF